MIIVASCAGSCRINAPLHASDLSHEPVITTVYCPTLLHPASLQVPSSDCGVQAFLLPFYSASCHGFFAISFGFMPWVICLFIWLIAMGSLPFISASCHGFIAVSFGFIAMGSLPNPFYLLGAPFAFWRPICLLGAPFAFWRPIPSDVQLQYL